MSFLKRIKWDAKRTVPPLVLAAIAIGYMADATGYSDATSAEAPMLYGSALLVLSILVFVLALVPGLRPEAKRGRTKTPEGPFPWGPSIKIFALIAGFLVLVYLAGFYVAIPLFLFLFLRGISKVSTPRSLISAAVSYAFVWLVFAYFLHLDVFTGYLSAYI